MNKVLVTDLPIYLTAENLVLCYFYPLCSQYCALALQRTDFENHTTRLGICTKMPRMRTETRHLESKIESELENQ